MLNPLVNVFSDKFRSAAFRIAICLQIVKTGPPVCGSSIVRSGDILQVAVVYLTLGLVWGRSLSNESKQVVIGTLKLNS